jgi:hypothetical protein
MRKAALWAAFFVGNPIRANSSTICGKIAVSEAKSGIPLLDILKSLC